MSEQVFVARERELEQLNAFLDSALAGQGQACFVTGEAGAGKTAVVTEFARRAQAADADLVIAVGNCNAQTGIGDPYLPFRQVLGMLTGDVEARLAQGAITQENAARLRDFVRISGQALVELGPDLINILVPGAGLATRVGTFLADKAGWLEQLEELTERPASASRNLNQSRIFEQVTAVLQALSEQQPLVLVLDDLHWVDASSAELLFHLGRSVADNRILIVGTYRLEEVAIGRGAERHPLEGVTSEFKRYFGDVWVDLGQAAEGEGRRFIDALVDTEPNRLGENFRQALVQHTQGNALFTTELLRDMRERDDLVRDEQGRWMEGRALDWDTLPARVEGVIETRIGRLDPDLRQALTVASVEGETFTAQVLAHVCVINERELTRRLSQELDKQHGLVREDGVVWVGQQPLGRYRFRHALFQKYLYDSLGEMEVLYLHGDIGNVLEKLWDDRTEDIAVHLAQHFEKAGIAGKAVYYLLEAGKQAFQLSANEEAIVHFTKGLAVLKTLPDNLERAQRELEFQAALGSALQVKGGWGAPEAGRAFARARELSQQAGDTSRLSPVLWGQWVYASAGGAHQAAREVGEALLSLGHRHQNPVILLAAHSCLGETLTHLGEFAAARAHLERGVSLYDPDRYDSFTYLYGIEAGLHCLTGLARVLWLLGYPDQAMGRIHESIALAEALSNPFSIVFALTYAVILHQFRHEEQLAQKRAEEIITLSAKHSFDFYLACGVCLRGWALAEQGQEAEGIAEMRRGLVAVQATGTMPAWSWFLCLPAAAYGRVGRAEEGLSLLAEGVAAVKERGDRSWEAELYRLKGHLLWTQIGAGVEVAACFQQAIEVARQQQAKSLELRAVMSLSRLLQKQERREEGRQMLAAVYGWFTEGFDTADLIEAKALLEELAS